MSEIIACFFGKSDLKQLHDATQNSDLLIKFIIVKQMFSIIMKDPAICWQLLNNYAEYYRIVYRTIIVFLVLVSYL